MMRRCPKCNQNGLDYDPRCKTWICLYFGCNHFEHEAIKKTRLVVEIKSGALVAAYCDSDIELILVDHDELEGYASSAVIVPDKLSEMNAVTTRSANDAVERAK